MTITTKRLSLNEAKRRLTGGDTAEDAQLAMRCINPPIGCGRPIEGFRDLTSKREYRISGLCQDCQDSVFGR